MTSTAAPDHASAVPRGTKRREVGTKNEGKKFVCSHDGCGRAFTRAEHLQRHLLNHSTGEYTCGRCRAHFKRRDLLERHMTRHRQKDEEAGAEGYGILNTRKRMWKDADGRIVTKKPTLSRDRGRTQSLPTVHHDDPLQSLPDFVNFSSLEEGAPISPPISNNASLSQSWDDQDSGIVSGYPANISKPNALSASDDFSPTDQRFWSTDLTQPQQSTLPDPFASATFDDAPFEEIFNPDTASSFNNPFTTMSNYNWLFDMDLNRPEPLSQPVIHDSLNAFSFNNDIVPQESHTFDLHVDHTNVDQSLSTAGQPGNAVRIDSPQRDFHPAPSALDTPPLCDDKQKVAQETAANPEVLNISAQVPQSTPTQTANTNFNVNTLLELERPMSMLQPSRSLPVIDELARQQLLDLIDIIQPTAPDGSIVMRDQPLLSLTCMQTYCDLFFTRFNTVYPLIHMSTFDPSEVDALLLISVLLLGATYGEKDAHQLAVCIHDVLRPQIFANAGFSAKPDLWVLQTILLVECFGKSRAGQKQHDMSHLFHGLLINLIRRSDCQSIRPPILEDATDDLENDWRTWCDAEQKKRLAFLCFMWDTQHAVLFCQSLCMSAFELRSTLPCDQSLWEADSAESWHQLRRKQSTPPLFLSCLKMYLHPSTTSIPKHLNALSRSLLLHGLMSVAWDMQRRDQTSLGLTTPPTPLSNWPTRLSTSYKTWHKDYTTFCHTYTRTLPSRTHPLALEFQTHRAATLALYHAAHILLHTPFLDLQIYAGSRHILGRAVARSDYVRSQRVVKRWVRECEGEAGSAVWHAAALVDEGVDVLGGEMGAGVGACGGDAARLWHYPWTVYLGALVVWGVWYARCSLGHSTTGGGGDEIVWDPRMEMKGLFGVILKSEPEGVLRGGGMDGVVGRKGTNGLAAVVSRCLSKVRWAVVHDGMMVLRGLVQWRLVGGGGMGCL
ncbi:hypothetical protein T440DRAFT_456029 [Plenodomus tracheiphilus IPT5]|uniref:C2H2-type domain-containing protein n=1 Tax=Plenodomus tracheiphilus IPT5 TaxID=1408161 RepID=A0A6A7AWC7_9PLEO|nr:hypothetical protein T440DRAFT_456029 [Plenodomus tracheiphilus IPT5]